MKRYYFVDGFMDIQEIKISFNKSARITALCHFQGGRVRTMKYIDVIGTEYTKWSTDDNYLISLCGWKVGMGKRVQQVIDGLEPQDIEDIGNYDFDGADSDTPYVPAPIEDNRSVHNEADVAKIQTLQTQLDEQAAKLKVITDLLIKTGAI